MQQFKGVATIQLFNAETGELEQEIKEENMITGAIEYMLNPPEYISGGLDPSTDRSFMTRKDLNSLASKAFSGVLIFRDPIEENVDNMMPPWTNLEIGHAGEVFSLSSSENAYSRIGTYNEFESGTLPSPTVGIRRVWDFGTEKANGIISCVCLTSRRGGTTGERRQVSNLVGGTQFNTTNNSPSYYNFLDRELNLSSLISHSLKFFYMEQQDNGDVRILGIKLDAAPYSIYEVILHNPFQQGLFSTACEIKSIKAVYQVGEQSYIDYNWKEENPDGEYNRESHYDILVEKNRLQMLLYQNIAPYVYKNEIHIVASAQSRNYISIRHIILDLDSYAIKQNKIITTEEPMKDYFNLYSYYSYSYSSNIERLEWSKTTNDYLGALYFDNHYFYYSKTTNTIIVIDENGNKVQSLSNVNFMSTYVDESEHYVLLGSGRGSNEGQGTYHILRKNSSGDTPYSLDSTTMGIQGGGSYSASQGALIKVKEQKLPFYATGGIYKSNANSYYLYLSCGYRYTFLSTINNLSTSVIKTNGQTMKITYDIIQVEE